MLFIIYKSVFFFNMSPFHLLFCVLSPTALIWLCNVYGNHFERGDLEGWTSANDIITGKESKCINIIFRYMRVLWIACTKFVLM